MKLSIIIPVFNEERTISQILKLIKEVTLPKGLTKEIIIVDDASTDATSQILKEQNKFIQHFRHSVNLGKGAAVRTGLQKVTGEVFIIQDADLEYNPKDYSRLLKPILERKAKVVYGTRLINYPLRFWGKNKTILPTHLIANKFLTFLTNLLYQGNLTDMETGYKVFKRQVLDDIKLNSNKFDFEAEITVKILKKGIKIFEVPISVNPRTYKEGKKIGWKDGVEAIRTLIKYRFAD